MIILVQIYDGNKVYLLWSMGWEWPADLGIRDGFGMAGAKGGVGRCFLVDRDERLHNPVSEMYF